MSGFFWCFYCNIYETKPDLFEIFRSFSRYLEKQSGISGNIFRQFSWYLYPGLTTAQVVEASLTVNKNSAIQDYVHPDDQTQPTFEYLHNKVPFYEDIVQLFLVLKITLLYS